MNELRVDVYKVLEECIQKGIEAGWNKAHKHTDKPESYQIFDQIEHYIMLEIFEKFKFDNEN